MRFYKSDTTYTMIGRTRHLSRPETSDNVFARELNTAELLRLHRDAKYDLSLSAIEGVAANANRHCFGTFNHGVISAYTFLATEMVNPDINTAGIGFGGIGMKLPDNVLYIYKSFSLPDYRGQRQVSIAVTAGADALVDSDGWMVSTVGVNNNASIRMLENVGLVKQDRLRENRIMGKAQYQIPKSIQLRDKESENNKQIELFTPA